MPPSWRHVVLMDARPQINEAGLEKHCDFQSLEQQQVGKKSEAAVQT